MKRPQSILRFYHEETRFAITRWRFFACRVTGITFIDPQTGLRADINIFIPSYVIT